MTAAPRPDYQSLDDAVLAGLVAVRDAAAVRLVTTRNNQRLFRAAFAILGDRAEAEDAVQAAWLSAFAAIQSFEGRSALSTWLTRIAINEALGRKRRQRPTVDRETYSENKREAEIIEFPVSAMTGDPERTMARSEIRAVLEQSIDELPDAFRAVFIARIVEGMSVEETAELFELKPETVKTRLFRARALLREALDRQLGPALTETFPFDGKLCERVTDAVIRRLAISQ